MKLGEEKQSFYLQMNLLLDIKWQEVLAKSADNPCISDQPSRSGKKLNGYSPCLENFLMYRMLVNPSELVATGLQIDSQIGRESHKILSTKTLIVCQENSIPGFGVRA